MPVQTVKQKKISTLPYGFGILYNYLGILLNAGFGVLPMTCVLMKLTITVCGNTVLRFDNAACLAFSGLVRGHNRCFCRVIHDVWRCTDATLSHFHGHVQICNAVLQFCSRHK
jgi:hypothetical protein